MKKCFLSLTNSVQRFAFGAIVALGSVATLSSAAAQAPLGPGVGYTNTPVLPNSQWRVHDKYRPRPSVVKAGDALGQAPSDATILFDGKDLSEWKRDGKKDEPAPDRKSVV